MAKKRGMDAVIEKASAANKGRKPALKRKGPGIAIMIAVGKPKPGMGKGPMGKGPMREAMEEKPKSKLAALEARIAELEAQLSKLEEDDEEMDDEEMGEDED
jgi:hypothetical protein